MAADESISRPATSEPYTILIMSECFEAHMSLFSFIFFRMEADILEATTQELMMHDYPSDCCPDGFYLRFPCIAGDPDSPFWQGWGNLRIKTFRLIENKYFETAVISMILISSMALV
jgi:hypothetical protein